MGLIRIFKSLTNTEFMCEEIIRTQEEVYEKYNKSCPGKDPHFILANVWLSRKAAHGTDVSNDMAQMLAFNETMQFACLPYPDNRRALALYILYKERPQWIVRFPKYGLEFNNIIKPVLEAMQSGAIEELYNKYNKGNLEDV